MRVFVLQEQNTMKILGLEKIKEKDKMKQRKKKRGGLGKRNHNLCLYQIY